MEKDLNSCKSTLRSILEYVVSQLVLSRYMGQDGIEKLTETVNEISVLGADSEEISDKCFNAIMETQFHDKQTQQINHIVNVIAGVVAAIKKLEDSVLVDPEKLSQLLDKNCSMPEEHEVKKAFMSSKQYTKAIATAREMAKPGNEDDDAMF